MYPTYKTSKYTCLQSCWWCKIGVKWPICPNKQQELLFSVMTLQYHTVYQISSLEANLSLEDKKTALRQKPPTQVYLP